MDKILVFCINALRFEHCTGCNASQLLRAFKLHVPCLRHHHYSNHRSSARHTALQGHQPGNTNYQWPASLHEVVPQPAWALQSYCQRENDCLTSTCASTFSWPWSNGSEILVTMDQSSATSTSQECTGTTPIPETGTRKDQRVYQILGRSQTLYCLAEIYFKLKRNITIPYANTNPWTSDLE